MFSLSTKSNLHKADPLFTFYNITGLINQDKISGINELRSSYRNENTGLAVWYILFRYIYIFSLIYIYIVWYIYIYIYIYS